MFVGFVTNMRYAKKQGGLIKSSASRPTVNEPFKHSASVRSDLDSRGAVVIKLKNRKSIFLLKTKC